MGPGGERPPAYTCTCRADYRTNFPAFVRFAFHELHPGQRLVETPHIDVLADHLARVARGEITRLIINMPPRSLKSFATSIALPAWLLGKDPTRQIMSVAGTKQLAADFEAATNALIATPRCRALFPHMKFEGRPGNLRLQHGGRRIAARVGGTLIGRGADLIVIDDPIAPAHVHEAARRNAVKKWFDSVVIQRLNEKKTGAVIVVMQRLHIEDLSGHLLGGEQPWVHLNMPAIATDDESWPLSAGRTIVRRKGEALAPNIEDRQQLFERMLDIGAYNFGAQYQQAPFEYLAPDEMRGGCFSSGDDELGCPTHLLGRVCEREIMAYELFGVGDRHPATRPRALSVEEFEQLMLRVAEYQRKLKEDT